MFTSAFFHIFDRVLYLDTQHYPMDRAIVFGAGGRGRDAVAALTANRVAVEAVVDNDPLKQGTSLGPVRIVGPESLRGNSLPVVIASAYEREIAAQLSELRVGPVYYFRAQRREDGVKILMEHLATLDTFYARLADDPSRRMFLQTMEFAMGTQVGEVNRSAYPQYDHPRVSARPGDVILDVGGMHGETAFFFADKLDRDCTVYTFEPSPRHRPVIQARARAYAGVVEHVPYGAWSCPTTLHFNSDFPADDPGSHRVAADGADEIEVIAIDDFVAERHLPRVDLIKMDIEGAELEALTGARETITRFLPKLHISMYHKPSDCWDIFDFINGINDRYTYYVGHHSAMHTETVLYALPDRRPA